MFKLTKLNNITKLFKLKNISNFYKPTLSIQYGFSPINKQFSTFNNFNNNTTSTDILNSSESSLTKDYSYLLKNNSALDTDKAYVNLDPNNEFNINNFVMLFNFVNLNILY